MPIERMKSLAAPVRQVVLCLAAAALASCGGGSSSEIQPASAPARIDRELAGCRTMMAGGQPPAVADDPALRGRCFETFAVVHDASSRTPKVVLEAIDPASLTAADAVPQVDNFYFSGTPYRGASDRPAVPSAL